MGSCLSTDQDSKRSLRREAKEVLALEAKNDQQLACFPGRMCSNGSNHTFSLFSQQGRKGVNQDAMIAWEGFMSGEDSAFCGVFDGHGPYGHLVARRVRDSLPLKLVVNRQESLSREEAAAAASKGEQKSPKVTAPGDEAAAEYDLYCTWKDLHLNAFKVMDRELQIHPSIDCFCSGTTAVTVLKQGHDLFIGNVGDSRAILGTTEDDGTYTAVPLTVDLKPNLPKEAERIRQCRGRVFALHDEPEVHRVWLPHENSPGLAMARAFGDFCLKEFGVIAVPEVFHHRLSEKDKFVVLATDGVWDVLSNEEVVNIISSNGTRSTAARALVESAVQAWMLKYPTSKIDDCAAVCLFLDTVVVDRRESKASSAAPSSVDIVTATSHDGAVRPPEPEPCPVRNGEEKSDWSALEGITRVNSLLSLPRFLGGSRRKRTSLDEDKR